MLAAVAPARADDGDESGPNRAELSVCARFLSDCLAADETPALARRVAAEAYPDLAGSNDARDAVRHCAWSALLTLRASRRTWWTFPKALTDAHEEGTPDNPPAEARMDLHNNAVGRLAGAIARVYFHANARRATTACVRAAPAGLLQLHP